MITTAHDPPPTHRQPTTFTSTETPSLLRPRRRRADGVDALWRLSVSTMFWLAPIGLWQNGGLSLFIVVSTMAAIGATVAAMTTLVSYGRSHAEMRTLEGDFRRAVRARGDSPPESLVVMDSQPERLP